MDESRHRPSAVTEQRTRPDREALLEILDDVSEAIAVLDEDDLRFTYLNDAYAELASGKDILGRTLREVWPEIAREIEPMIRHVLETGERYQAADTPFEIRRSPDGAPERRFFTFTYCRFSIDGRRELLVDAFETTSEVEARAAAETAARSAEQHASLLSSLFEGMADGFFALDTDWRFRYANGNAERLLRQPRDRLLGHRIWDLFPDAVGTPFEKSLQDAMRERKPVEFKEFYAPSDMWASVHALPSPTGLSVFLSDITSLKESEAALARSEAQLRAMIDNSPDVILMKDIRGMIIRVNEQLARDLGMPKEKIAGLTDFDLVPEQTAEEIRAHDRQVIERGEPMQFEEGITTKDGKLVRLLTTRFPLKDASGRIYAVASISVDITERVEQARAVAESEQRLRKIFEEGPIGIVLYDVNDFHIVTASDTYARMLGYSKEELQAMTPFDVTLPAERDIAKDLAVRLVRGEIPLYRVEKRYLRKDGGTFWVSVTGSLIRDEAGRPSLILGMVEDITTRKRAEEVVRDRDQAIRAAYTDVIAAVTGGKLVLMTPGEMRAALGRPVGHEWKLDDFCRLAEVRHALAPALLAAGLPPEDAEDYVLAAGEAMANAIKHGGGGLARVRRTEGAVQIEITDHGPAIDFEDLPKATLQPGFSTKQSLGMGFTIMLEACDRVLLTTQPGLTILLLEKTL
jgi:PAS domain S-box-containing protein